MNKRLYVLTFSLGSLFCSPLFFGQVAITEPKELSNQDLVGPQRPDVFLQEPHKSWFLPEYEEYMLDQKTIEKIKKFDLSNLSIEVLVGSWCPDSHREYPRFIKIIEAVGFPMDKISITALDRNKVEPSGSEKKKGVTYVPTFIYYLNGKEIGRIVEFPTSGYIERDMLSFIESASL